MPRGGARNRSGPPFDPNSGRSDARGIVLTALPSEGFRGDAPDFPLPNASVRELEVWVEAWATPQAAAWSVQPWRIPIIGEYARLKVICEGEDGNASLIAQLHRYRDQLGLTPAGLKENGWAVAVDEIGQRAAGKTARAKSSRDRMKVVPGGAG